MCICECVVFVLFTLAQSSFHCYYTHIYPFLSGALDAPFDFCAMVLELKAFPNALSMVVLSVWTAVVKQNKGQYPDQQKAESAR